jgi:acid phosphatase
VGLYPFEKRSASFPPPKIVTRTFADETLFPNDASCRRFKELSRAFAQRSADRWNDSEDVKYLNKLIAAWMPSSSPKVAVDSHPRLTGIMDTINASLAHGPATRLPPEFYDPKGRKIIEKIGVEEWYSGYNENREYRALGIGALVGDLVERMTASIEHAAITGPRARGEDGPTSRGKGDDEPVKFALSGCHDTTIAGLLTSLGAFDGDSWPPFTSHIALELFRTKKQPPQPQNTKTSSITTAEETNPPFSPTSRPGWLSSLLGLASSPSSLQPRNSKIGRRPTSSLTAAEKSKMTGYYVRIRYNDRVVTVPGCTKAGNHREGDPTLCTMAAFKAIADDFTPRDWKRECEANMDGETVRPVGKEEWAGGL